MRCHRDAHDKSAKKDNISAPNNSTGAKRKRSATQKNPAGAKKRALAAPKHTLSAEENTLSAQENAVPAINDPPVTARQPPAPRNGLDNSPINALPAELRLSIIQFKLQGLRKVAIVSKSMVQSDDAVPAAKTSEPSLVFVTESALSKTCHALHTQYADELASQVAKCKVPSLALHVRDFDFTPFTRELFSTFKDSHRAFFNAREGAITIYLTLTPSFFARGYGECGRMVWLAKRDLERLGRQNGLIQWLEWRKAEEKAGRKVSVAYKLLRNHEVEGVEDREALRQFMLLFDPLSRGEGDVGGILQKIIEVFKEIKDSEARAAQEEESEEELEEEPEEEEDSEMSE